MEGWRNLLRSEAVSRSSIITTGLPCVSGASGPGRVVCKDAPPTFFTEIGRTKMGWKVSTGRSTSAQSQDALSSKQTLAEMVRVHLKVLRGWGF